MRWKKAALENCTGVPCIIIPPPPSFTCGTSIISDIDNNSYNTVSIGTQCWTKENLRVRRYNDGTELRFDTSGGNVGNSSSTWSGIGLKYGAYTLYAHDSTTSPSNFTNYGYLYNWYAVAGIITDGGNAIKNICPTGWHVPTDSEWTNLIQHLDNTALPSTVGSQSSIAGGKIKSNSTLWNAPNTGANNSSNFSALPSGHRFTDGRFIDLGLSTYFWSATEMSINSSGAIIRNFYYNLNDAYRDDTVAKSIGSAVRCLKN